MGIELAKMFVSVRGDMSRTAGDIHAGRPAVESAAQALQSTVNRILAGIGVGLSVAGIVSEFRQGISLAQRQIDAEARLAEVVRGTGMAAGFTADQLKRMASMHQTATTTGDEEWLEMAAIMLTFKSIQGDVFKSATATVLDMAAVMGTNATSAAMQLGRALEDPIRGVGALRRTGVSFSEEQKVYIKQLAESGKLNEAQAFVLSVVRGQLGEVAKAMAATDSGKLKQAQNVLGDLREEIGRRLLPLQIKLIEVQQQFTKGMIGVIDLVKLYKDEIAAAVKVVVPAVSAILGLKLALMGTSLAFSTVFSAVRLLLSPMGLLAVVVGVLAVKFQVFDNLAEKLKWLSEQARISLRFVQNLFEDVWNRIEEALRFDVVVNAWGKFAIQIRETIVWIQDKLGQFGKFLDIMFGSWEGLKIGGSHIFAKIGFFFEKVWAYAKYLIKVGFARLLPVVHNLTAQLVEKMAEWLEGVPIIGKAMEKKAKGLKFAAGMSEMLAPAVERGLGDQLARDLDDINFRASMMLRAFEAVESTMPKLSDWIRRIWRQSKDELWFEDLGRQIEEWMGGALGKLKSMALEYLPKLLPEPKGAVEVGGVSTAGAGTGIEAGRFGFAEYGRRLQDMMLKADDPAKETANNTKEIAKTIKEVSEKFDGYTRTVAEYLAKGAAYVAGGMKGLL